MTRSSIPSILVALTLLIPCAAAASVGLPYVGVIQYAFEEASILITPDGSGPGLDEACGPGGTVVDATIAVQLVDISWLPIAVFPAEDLWLQFEVSEGTVGGCEDYGPYFDGGVFIADHDTDANGWTEFRLPLRGGGWSEGPAYVYLNGEPAQSPDVLLHPPIPLRAKSPDLNGDLLVNLSDIAVFSYDLFGPYHVRSDLWWDEAINLSDVVWFTRAIGVTCD